MIGSVIAHYKVTARIGAGGMGEVYRATDTKLGRDVALKVLPEAFAQDSQRMQRFQREAQVLASLNHPGIAAIYGFEEGSAASSTNAGAARSASAGAASSAPTVHALVMELVEGPTLAERIAQGPIPVEEALPIAKQIAEALEYAHDRGIIHRDLKPANIKLTPDGKVKILDFGLAKALAGDAGLADASSSPTLSIAATQAGIILGTAAYMSPEQARGKPADRRADIWAFGVVLFEMLAGRQVFGGETASDSMAAVITREPEWPALPSSTPAQMRELLRRCFVKDPRQRLQAIGEARIAVERAMAHPEAPVAEPSGIGPAAAIPAWKLAMPWALAGVLAITAILASWKAASVEPEPSRAVQRFVVEMPRGQVVYGPQPGLAISPTGTHVVYLASRLDGPGYRLYMRALDQLDATPIGDADGTFPFFSPDGQWIGYFAAGKMKKISIQGGTAVSLCDAPQPRGASWQGNTIIYSPHQESGLWKVSADGGQPEEIKRQGSNTGVRDRWPEILPGGEAVLFASETAGTRNFGVMVLSLRTGESKELVDSATQPRYVASGHLVFAREGTLYAAPFDATRLEVTGPAAPVVENARMDVPIGAAYYSVSRDGTLVYISTASRVSQETSLAVVDRKGTETSTEAPSRPYAGIRLSPDGTRVAARVADTNIDVWIYSLARKGLSRLTFQPDEDESPVWTADSRRIAYGSTLQGGGPQIAWRNADGSGEEEVLWQGGTHLHVSSISSDQRWLLFTDYNSITRGDIWILPLQGERKPQPFLKTPFNEYDARFSPDGKWVVYSSDESETNEIYVQPFPGPGGKWQISADGGDSPIWAPNGKEIFYRHGNRLMAVSIATTPSFSPASARLLFEGPSPDNPRREAQYDVFPDGQRFLMLKGPAAAIGSGQYYVVTNWTEELKRLAPPKR